MGFHASNAHIDLAIVFTVHFSVDVHMKQRLLVVEQCPVVQGLVEGVVWEVLLEQVVRIYICFTDYIGNSPEKKRVFACGDGEVGGQKGCIDLTLVNSEFFLIFLAASIKFFGVGSSEQDRTFLDAGYVLLFEMIVRCFFHHCNSLIIIAARDLNIENETIDKSINILAKDLDLKRARRLYL